MEKGFEERLHVYGEAARINLEHEVSTNEIDDPEVLAVQQVLNGKLDEISNELLQSRNAHPQRPEEVLGSEQQIKEIQTQKQQIMQELHDSLRLLDEPGRHQIGDPEGMQTRYMDGQLQVSSDELGWDDISVGELVTDREWGSTFRLKTGKIPREICKQFLVERAKFELSTLLNDQILLDQLSDRFMDTGKKEAYQSLQAEREKIPRFGHVAEVMIKNFMMKLRLDHGLDVEVQLGDAYHDVEQKIDFIIRRTNHVRGVTLEENDRTDSIAIQLTINTDNDVMLHKSQQVEKSKRQLMREGAVDDMALVLIGQSISAEMRQVYETWNKDKTPGGPDKLLSQATQELLFKTILEKMYTPEELNQRWQKMIVG